MTTSRHIVALLQSHLAGDEERFLTIATQLEAHALTRWLQELPLRKKPWIVILFLSDRWNRSGPDEYDRQIGEFRTLAATISSLTPEDARRMIFFAATDLLAQELRDLLGTNVDVAPNPLPYGDPQSYSSSTRASHLRGRRGRHRC